MTTWIYRKTEPTLWTTGHYNSDGKWEPENDYGTPDEAAARVHWLNGGSDEPDSAFVAPPDPDHPAWTAPVERSRTPPIEPCGDPKCQCAVVAPWPLDPPMGQGDVVEPTRDEVAEEFGRTWDGVDRSGLPERSVDAGNQCTCPGGGTHAHVRGCRLHPDAASASPAVHDGGKESTGEPAA